MSSSEKLVGGEAILAPSVVVRGTGAGFSQEITVGDHRLQADEPVSSGGTDTGPSPYDLLLAALGSCTSTTLGIYARRKNWQLDEIIVRPAIRGFTLKTALNVKSNSDFSTALSWKWN